MSTRNFPANPTRKFAQNLLESTPQPGMLAPAAADPSCVRRQRAVTSFHTDAADGGNSLLIHTRPERNHDELLAVLHPEPDPVTSIQRETGCDRLYK